MRKFVTIISLISIFSVGVFAQDQYKRSAVLEADTLDVGGFGNIVVGEDLDGDGLLEIYAVNNDWHDIIGFDLVPRIYKYEQVSAGSDEWAVVWSTRLALDFQNTWPPLAVADLDNDGKGEIVWGPINNTGGGLQLTQERIVVFETPGDGSDVMGVDNGDGTYRPNATYEIDSSPGANVRPFKWYVTDIDSDGTDEIVAFCRAGDGIQIFSVIDVPDNANGTDFWIAEYSGIIGTFYDGFVIGNTAYGIQSNGDVASVASENGIYVEKPLQTGVVGAGSWNSASVADFDGDSNLEAVAASWDFSTNNIYLLQQSGDTLASTIINDVPDSAFRLYGGAVGDFNGDDNLDFGFGTREANPIGSIYNLSYNGGAIADTNSWTLVLMDTAVSLALQYDVFDAADLNNDGIDELVYTGTPRGLNDDQAPQPIVVLTLGPPTAIVDDGIIPSDFSLEQNYPNPFNPETTIRFTIPQAADVTLNVYNIRGQLVRTLVNQTSSAGTYSLTWDGTDQFGYKVASGTYIYSIKAGNFVETKKMILVK